MLKVLKEERDNKKEYADMLVDTYRRVMNAKKEFDSVISTASHEFIDVDDVNYGNVGSLNHIAEIIEEATNRIAVHARIPGYKDKWFRMIKIIKESIKKKHLKEDYEDNFICGYPIEGATLFIGYEFDEFMKEAIEEAGKDE